MFNNAGKHDEWFSINKYIVNSVAAMDLLEQISQPKQKNQDSLLCQSFLFQPNRMRKDWVAV